jgi:hypothetical protein
MGLNASAFNISTMLLVGLACWVVYIRTRPNSNESNIPLFYYAIIVYYVITYGDWTSLPPILVYVSCVLALLLRFEFMNTSVSKLVSMIECCGLAAIMYFNLATVFGWS